MRVLRVLEGPVIGVLLFLLFVETALPVYGTLAHVTEKAGPSSQHTSGKQQAVHKLMSGLSQQSGKTLDSLAQVGKLKGRPRPKEPKGQRLLPQEHRSREHKKVALQSQQCDLHRDTEMLSKFFKVTKQIPEQEQPLYRSPT